MRILIDIPFLRSLLKAEQLSMFGPSGMAPTGVGGPRRVTQVKAHTRQTQHGATFISPHQTHVRAPTNAEKTAERARALAARTMVHYSGGGRGQEPPAREVSMSSKTETRVWRGRSDGMAAGEIRKMKGYDGYRVVTAVGPAKTRRLTSYDEDQGNGMQGSYQTTQSVTHRPATPEEGAHEDARLASVEDAKREADPNHRLNAWLAGNPGASHLPEMGPEEKAIDALGLRWSDVATDVKVVGGAHMGRTLQTATGPDGRAYARMRISSPDDPREVYYAVRDTSAVDAEAAKAAAVAEAAALRTAEQRERMHAVTTPPGGWTMATARAAIDAAGINYPLQDQMPVDHPYMVAMDVVRNDPYREDAAGHVSVARLRALGVPPKSIRLNRSTGVASGPLDATDQRAESFRQMLHTNERGDFFVTGYPMGGTPQQLPAGVVPRGAPGSVEESDDVRAAGVPADLHHVFRSRAELEAFGATNAKGVRMDADRILSALAEGKNPWQDIHRMRVTAAKSPPGAGAKLTQKQVAALAAMGIHFS